MRLQQSTPCSKSLLSALRAPKLVGNARIVSEFGQEFRPRKPGPLLDIILEIRISRAGRNRI